MTKLLKRTAMAGELNADNISQTIVLNGWIAKRRNLGGLIFCDLRDRSGIVQIVFNEDIPKRIFELADSLRSEYVVGIKGEVRRRESPNKELDTGEIEVLAYDLVVYSQAETPPIYIKDEDNVDDNLRLKYRYLDLRKPSMQEALYFRNKVTGLAREYFFKEGFIEIETPMLIKPTPEGARDYLVPSRVNKGSFYALPQSPQMFKQLLMVGGTDRYIQIAKCFRDEDLRADRQPEFTQIDLEMSFVDEEEVIRIQEGFLALLFRKLMQREIKLPLPRLTYEEAMNRFGSDKPDTRFGFELRDITDTVRSSTFKTFSDTAEQGGSIRGISITGGANFYTRKKIDKLIEKAKDYGAKGLVWIKYSHEDITSSVNKFFEKEELLKIADKVGAEKGDLILICADRNKVVFDTLGFLRRHIAEELGILDKEQYNLLWVTDFPLYEKDEDTGKYNAMHHPFTSPKEEDIKLLEKEPFKAKARAYDIVLNGVELGGGSIRIHNKELQEKMFSVLGLSKEEIKEKFGFLVEAFKYGVPPHGGIAYGLDRLVMILLGRDTIRDVIAFPKNQAAACMVSEAPSVVSCDQLEELGLEIKKY